MNANRLRSGTLCLLLLLVSLPLAAQGQVGVTATVRDGVAEIGQNLVLDVVLGLPQGLSVTAEQVILEVVPSDTGDWLDAPYPLAEGPAGTFEWAAPIKPDAAPQDTRLTIQVSVTRPDGQVLTGRTEVDVQVAYGKEWNADRISNFIDRKGIIPFLAVVFGFGLLMSLSPCIYPMIPITLAVIGASGQDKGPVQGLFKSFTYVLGMAFVYAILGALSATAATGLTAFLQSPTVLIPIALLMLLLSFAMFGAYELEAPAFLRDRLGGPGGNRGGLVGVFFMGMVAGLVASPCVGPFLAALLLWVATTGNILLGFFSLLIFGLGMGVLLMAVGTFPSLMSSMPNSGGWMETIKKGMGLLLVAMAFYFVRPEVVIPAKYFNLLVSVTLLLVSVFMGAFDGLTAAATWWDRTRKALAILVLFMGLGGLVTHAVEYGRLGEVMGGSETVQVSAPAAATRVAGVTPVTESLEKPAVLPDKVQWEIIKTGNAVEAFLAERQATAKATGQPVMIDFWATWCVYCKKLDKSVWNQPEVVAEAQRFVTIKIDATDPDDAEMSAIKERFQVTGLPRVVFIDSRGEILHGRASGFKTASEMLTLLKSIR